MEPAAYRADAILAEVGAKCREMALRDYGIEVRRRAAAQLRLPEAEPPPACTRA